MELQYEENKDFGDMFITSETKFGNCTNVAEVKFTSISNFYVSYNLSHECSCASSRLKKSTKNRAYMDISDLFTVYA